MFKFSDEFMSRIRGAVRITDIVGEHVVLRKSGANYVGLCPFHSERTPSFSVNESKQLYHCYGCKKGGDLFHFVMEIHGIGFREAVLELAERGRVVIPKEVRAGLGDGQSVEAQNKKAELQKKISTAFKLNRFVAAFYHQNLASMPTGRDYLLSRGIGEEFQKSFHLGVASGAWDSLFKHLQSKKAPLELALELGLIRRSQNGSGCFDLFRNRVIFPILDMRGRVVGFGGRLVPSEFSEQEERESPKYMNSTESFLFHKGKEVFGLFQAQKHIRDLGEVVIVEGYFDVLALHAAGFQNAVATCGTSLTTEHLMILKKFASRVTLLFDSDKAGEAATGRAMELGLENGMVLNAAQLPEGLDPDAILFDQKSGERLPGGQEKMAAILSQAKPALDTEIERSLSIALSGGQEAKTQGIKKIAKLLAIFSDPIGREVRAQYVRERLGVTERILNQAMGAPARYGSVAVHPAAEMRQRPVSHGEPIPIERILLKGAAIGGEFLSLIRETGSSLPPYYKAEDIFEHIPSRDAMHQILETLRPQDRPDPNRFQELIEKIQDPQVRSVLTETWVASEQDFSLSEFRNALNRAIARVWARFSHQIKAALRDAELKKDVQLQENLMKEYLDVQRRMKEFNSFYDEA